MVRESGDLWWKIKMELTFLPRKYQVSIGCALLGFLILICIFCTQYQLKDIKRCCCYLLKKRKKRNEQFSVALSESDDIIQITDEECQEAVLNKRLNNSEMIQPSVFIFYDKRNTSITSLPWECLWVKSRWFRDVE